MHLVQEAWSQTHQRKTGSSSALTFHSVEAEYRSQTCRDQIPYFRLSYLKHARVSLTDEPFLR